MLQDVGNLNVRNVNVPQCEDGTLTLQAVAILNTDFAAWPLHSLQ
jgi:hypothetical protein